MELTLGFGNCMAFRGQLETTLQLLGYVTAPYKYKVSRQASVVKLSGRYVTVQHSTDTEYGSSRLDAVPR